MRLPMIRSHLHINDPIASYDAELERSLDAVACEQGGLTPVQRTALAREIDELLNRLICAICRRRLWGGAA